MERAPDEVDDSSVDDEYESTPWHFKLLLLAFVLYMLFRLVQLIIWMFGHWF